MRTLPSLPNTIRALHDSETLHLREQYVNLQRDPEHCPVCLGTKTFKFYDDMMKPLAQREVVDYECPCEDQFRLSRFLLNHGIGRQFAKLWWGDSTEADPASQAFILDYVGNGLDYVRNGLGLFLHGSHGTGKSMFGALVLKRFIGMGLTGYWTTFDQLLDSYTSTWRNPDERVIFDRTVRNVSVLVVDDVGREGGGRQSSMSESAIDSMFRTRAQHALTTIVTTNLDQKQFLSGYSKAVASLVSECCLPHEFIGANRHIDVPATKQREMLMGISRPVTLG